MHQLDLSDCHVGRAQFDGMMFAGSAWFRDVEFASDALCEGAEFIGYVGFVGVGFTGWSRTSRSSGWCGTVGLLLIIWHVQDLVVTHSRVRPGVPKFLGFDCTQAVEPSLYFCMTPR